MRAGRMTVGRDEKWWVVSVEGEGGVEVLGRESCEG